MGNTGVGLVMQGWGCVGWAGSCRSGVGHSEVGWGGSCRVGVE